MARNAVKKRAPEDDHGSTVHAKKRVKSASGSEVGAGQPLQSLETQPTTRRLNRLQRAIPKEVKSTSKRTTTTVLANKLKRAEKKKGVLAALLHAPIDILYEISLQLSPADLLCLSRVSHDLRSFFLTKSNRRIWVDSLASVDLPPCPEDLCEPQYASLVFDTNCIACDEPHVKSLDSNLRLRMCKDCFPLNVVRCDTIAKEIVECETYKIEPGEYTSVMIATCEFVPSETLYYKSGMRLLSYRPDFQDAFLECLSQYRTNTPEEFQAFVARKKQLKENNSNHAAKLRRWFSSRAKMRSSELTDLAKRHEESVKVKLRELGYTDEDWDFRRDCRLFDSIIKSQRPEWKALVRQKRELTARTWKTLFPKLEAFLLERRRRARKADREDEFDAATLKYCRELNLTFGELALVLTGRDLRAKEEIKDILYFDDAQRKITDEVWDSFLPVMERIWRKEKFDALLNHEKTIRRSAGQNNDTEDLNTLYHIRLASSFFFEAFGSRHTIYYFNSIHSIGTYPPRYHIVPHEDSISHSDKLSKYCTPINLGIPNALLADLDLPLSSTMTHMLKLGECFMCCRCSEQFREVMTWPGLVKHYVSELQVNESLEQKESIKASRKLGIKYINDHSFEGGSYARILEESAITSVREQQKIRSGLPRRFGCALCVRLHLYGNTREHVTYPQVEEHIRTKHGIEPSLDDIITYSLPVDMAAYLD